jgi:uncharacterized membrane protein YedE/YeeE
LVFLDFVGAWDLSLVFVMVGAIGVHATLWQLLKRAPRSAAAPPLPLPPSKTIDARLVSGAALFGVGWGLAGICPGPGVVVAAAALVQGGGGALAFLAALLVGSKLHDVVKVRWDRGYAPPSSAP